MRGSFAKAGVLYAPVEEIGSEGRLLRACRILASDCSLYVSSYLLCLRAKQEY